jgi:hypothetical protein
VSAFFLLSGYDTCIALLFSSSLRDSLLFQVVVVDWETMQRYIPNSESEDTSVVVLLRPSAEKRRPSLIRKLERPFNQYFSFAF